MVGTVVSGRYGCNRSRLSDCAARPPVHFSRTALRASALAGTTLILSILVGLRLTYMPLIGKALAYSPLLGLGQRSYEVYLTHMFVVFTFFAIFVHYGNPIWSVPLLFVATVIVLPQSETSPPVSSLNPLTGCSVSVGTTGSDNSAASAIPSIAAKGICTQDAEAESVILGTSLGTTNR